MKKNILTENMLRFGPKNLTESERDNLKRLTEQGIAKGAGSFLNTFEVGQRFKEITNSGYIKGRSYQLTRSGLSDMYGLLNDFSFDNPEIVEVTSERVNFKLDYGYYNPNESWKNGQTDTTWTNFCLSVPIKYITQPIKDNEVQIQVPNHTLSLYKKDC